MKKRKIVVTSLRKSLSYEPVELSFGTSGLRGLVKDISSLETYANTRGFLTWLLAGGRVAPGSPVFLAGDLRPSTASIVADPVPRGEIMHAVCRAVADVGLSAVNLGTIPTPALALYAMKRRAPAIMVTGSHIPYDRNGIKFTTPNGEVMKADETPILAAVHAVRVREYARSAEDSLFDANGMLRADHRPDLPEVNAEASEEYARRYLSAFPAGALAGLKVLVWEHSSVGRDLLARILGALGAEVVPAGRTDEFVAVDTEAVDERMLHAVQALVDARGGGTIDAVVSLDGDGDRPLVLAVDSGKVRFVPGDLLGLVAAEYLGARHVAVPVNANDAVEGHCRARGITLVKTRIGSPHVIAALREVGWEANGGFLTAAPVTVPGGGTMDPLPTRDSLLPILSALCAARAKGVGVSSLLDSLPRRFGRSAVVRDLTDQIAREIVRWLSPSDGALLEARFGASGAVVLDAEGTEKALEGGSPAAEELAGIRARVARHFTKEGGFGAVAWINWLDGPRIGFDNGDVVHLRPSGNAPEMRVYANAGSTDRAARIVETVIADGGTLGGLANDASERIALAGFRSLPRPILLHGAVQHYDWGGLDYIPGLLGVKNEERRPFAELWMGAHPRAPAAAEIDGTRIRLDRLIEADPWMVLGVDDALRFTGRLPYLFKVLDVRIMASIQAHPSKAQAEQGFARENAAGIPVDAPRRNYRDENHKPEVHVVLTDFWMLHGFRPLEEIAEVLASEQELAACMPGFEEKLGAAAGNPDARSLLLRELYERVMTMPQAQVDDTVTPLVTRLEAEDAGGALSRDHPGFWALRAARSFPLAEGHRDRSIISIYLLNLLHLKPGQATYQPSGTLHAYLEGADVELMASSDNVLRGGLTPKHVDVPELLATLDFKDGRPPILEGRAASETGREYETPAEEFALERIEISQGLPYWGGRGHGVDSLIVIEGAAAVVAAGRTLALGRGGVCLVPSGVPYSIAARSPRAVLFKAGVPAPD